MRGGVSSKCLSNSSTNVNARDFVDACCEAGVDSCFVESFGEKCTWSSFHAVFDAVLKRSPQPELSWISVVELQSGHCAWYLYRHMFD